MKKIILLFGPTASGKSRLAIDLAQNYSGEIVNADSMQVYSEIKILSARPNEKKLNTIYTDVHLLMIIFLLENGIR